MSLARRILVAASIAGVGLAASVSAQLVWDIAPEQREIPQKQQIDDDLARSRFRLGPVRIIPGFAVNDAGYDSNVFATPTDPFADWFFSIHAGARFLVPFGSKLYLRASAFPSYRWYDKLSDRRGFGGDFEAGLLGFFNHMTVQLEGTGSEGFQIYSSELNSRVLTRDVGGFGRVEVDLSRRFAVFVSGGSHRIRYSQPEGPLDQQVQVLVNNRTDSSVRGGLRYRLAPDWSVDALVEETWSDFEFDPAGRNNRSTAYQMGVHYDRPKLYVNLTGGYRQGRADDSTFPEYSIGTGAFFVSYFPIRWLELQATGHRGVSYSISLEDPYYIENRLGGAAYLRILPPLVFRGFGSAGPNEYPGVRTVNGVQVNRRDQVRTYGGGVTVPIRSYASITGLVTRNDYASNVPGATQAYTRYSINVLLGGELTR